MDSFSNIRCIRFTQHFFFCLGRLVIRNHPDPSIMWCQLDCGSTATPVARSESVAPHIRYNLHDKKSTHQRKACGIKSTAIICTKHLRPKPNQYRLVIKHRQTTKASPIIYLSIGINCCINSPSFYQASDFTVILCLFGSSVPHLAAREGDERE